MFVVDTKSEQLERIHATIRNCMRSGYNNELRWYDNPPPLRYPDPADIMIKQVNGGVFTYKPHLVGQESSDMVYGVYFGTTGKKQLFCISKKRIAQFCHVERRIMWMGEGMKRKD